MFKRANKITSLLVAAAAVVSLVPVTGVNAAEVKKVNSEDGIIYNAVAFKDGSALIDGEVKDNDGAYYLAGGKYTELEDVDSGSDYAAYGSKYVEVDTDKYYVDLTNGKVTDDSVKEDDQDDASTALRKKIKDADRYGDDATTIAKLTEISGNKFGETWYATQAYTIKKGVNSNTTPSIYTDNKGAYIDADYNLGKIKVETTGSGISGAVTVENTVDTEDLKDNNTKFATVDAKIVANTANELGQDKDNIYRYAQIKVTVTPENGKTISSMEINGKVFEGTTVTLDVIQKISKAQHSDDVDDAKYAKNVTNYIISDDSTKVGNDEGKYLTLAQDKNAEARVIGGKLALFTVTQDAKDDNVKVQAATLKSKNGYYFTDVEGTAYTTAEFNTNLNKVAVDTDVDGNIYVVDGGYIKKFDGADDWTKVYKVDGSFDALSVYDKDNMVAWSQGDEVYSLIGGKSTEEKTDETTAVKTGWAQATDGTWTYVKADGTKATGWLQLGSAWYYLKADGVMATGWVLDGTTWYFLNANGSMATGWLQVGSEWYYLNANGSMAANAIIGGYTLGANGAWVK